MRKSHHKQQKHRSISQRKQQNPPSRACAHNYPLNRNQIPNYNRISPQTCSSRLQLNIPQSCLNQTPPYQTIFPLERPASQTRVLPKEHIRNSSRKSSKTPDSWPGISSIKCPSWSGGFRTSKVLCSSWRVIRRDLLGSGARLASRSAMGLLLLELIDGRFGEWN